MGSFLPGQGSPNLFMCVLVLLLNLVFRQERFNRFLWFLESVIKNGGNLRNRYLFSLFSFGIKFFEISAYLKICTFTKDVNNLETPWLQFFSLTAADKPQSSQLLCICTFEVNRDHTTRCTKCWCNLTLKCYANTFVKVDAQIEKDCRRTICYLKGYSYFHFELNAGWD